MIEQAFDAPLTFWLVAALLAAFVTEGVRQWTAAWAKPALVVYGTIGVWYLGDYLMSPANGYSTFTPEVVEVAFLQVAVFLVLVRVFMPMAIQKFCGGLKDNPAQRQISQRTLFQILGVVAGGWLALFLTAVALRDGQWLPLLWPPIQKHKLGMFVHPGMGSGADFLMAAAAYIHQLICALFGPLAVLGRGRVRYLSLMMMAISWPYFFFDRIRNTMLALLLPGVACYWSFNRQRTTVNVVAGLLLLTGVSFWFHQVMAYRATGTSNIQVFLDVENAGNMQHYGLDMMKELCWISTLIDNGRFSINWGRQYFSEVVNVIPRTFWPGKPTIALDYAAARGFLRRGTNAVNATIAMGMVGQGIVNFGPYLGIPFGAAVVAIWIAILSRLWLQRMSLLRMLLFFMGLGLTFNMGRGVTLLVLFPFVFGYIGVRLGEHFLVAPVPARDAGLPRSATSRPASTK